MLLYMVKTKAELLSFNDFACFLRYWLYFVIRRVHSLYPPNFWLTKTPLLASATPLIAYAIYFYSLSIGLLSKSLWLRFCNYWTDYAIFLLLAVEILDDNGLNETLVVFRLSFFSLSFYLLRFSIDCFLIQAHKVISYLYNPKFK